MLVLALLAVLANTDPKGVSIERCQEDDIDCIWIETYGSGPISVGARPVRTLVFTSTENRL